MRAKLLKLMTINASLPKKLYAMSKRLHRKRKAADSLQGIVEELRKDAVLDDKACRSIKAAADNIPAEIVKQMTSNLKSKNKTKRL